MGSDAFSVSVVIPAYNEAARIAVAVESALGQTHPPDEVIVVDDGSTDGTGTVAAALGARVVRKPNGGLSSARNAGIRAARGDWIALLDADDLWVPAKLAAVHAAQALDPEPSFIFSDFDIVRAGVVLGSQFASIAHYGRCRKTRLADDAVRIERRALLTALVVGNFIAPSTVVVRRNLLFERDLFFDERLLSTPAFHMSEDIEWYLRVLGWSDAIALERPLVRYVRHAASLSVSAGRLKLGDVKLGERIAAESERYPQGTSAQFAAARRFHLKTAAELYARELDFASCRAMLRSAQQERFEPGDLALELFAAGLDNATGRAAARIVRTAWRRALKPALERARGTGR